MFKLEGEAQAELIKWVAIIGALITAYSWVKSTVSNVDLNPFDENGFLGLKNKQATLESPIIAGYDSSHIAALKAQGKDIKNYYVYYPNLLTMQALPAGTYKVAWGANKEKITYYAPKTGLEVFTF